MNLDSGLDYGIDVCADELTSDALEASAEDLRALANGLRQLQSPAEIRRALTSVASLDNVDDYAAMVSRGFEQIRDWLRETASPKLCEAAGLVKVGHA